MSEEEVNKRLNREYPKLLQAVHSRMPEQRKKAVVYKFCLLYTSDAADE